MTESFDSATVTPAPVPLCSNCVHWAPDYEMGTDGGQKPTGWGKCHDPLLARGVEGITRAGYTCQNHAFKPADQPPPDAAEIDRRILAGYQADVDRLSAALAEAEQRPTREDMREAIAAAVAAEREACARMVDAAADARFSAWSQIAPGTETRATLLSTAQSMKDVAAAIRAEPLP